MFIEYIRICDTESVRISLAGKNHFSGYNNPALKVITLFSRSAQLSMKFILLINVKMPTTVGILTFISRINTKYSGYKAKQTFSLQYFGL